MAACTIRSRMAERDRASDLACPVWECRCAAPAGAGRRGARSWARGERTSSSTSSRVCPSTPGVRLPLLGHTVCQTLWRKALCRITFRNVPNRLVGLAAANLRSCSRSRCGSPMRSHTSVLTWSDTFAPVAPCPVPDFLCALVGRDAHDYDGHSARAGLVHGPNLSPRHWQGETSQCPGSYKGTVDK